MLLAVLLLGGTLSSFAQPSNDDPCNAIPLTVGATCSLATFTNAGATATAIADPNCTFYQGGDVWFSVVVPANGNLQLDAGPGDFTDGGMAVYTGACNALTEIACDDDASVNGAMPYIVITNQIPGSTLFVRFWEYGGDEFGEFQICAAEYTPPTPPANDECINAIPLSVNPDLNCALVTAATTAGATQSNETAATCGSAGSNDDIWFTFVATETTHVVSETITGGNSGDLATQLYSGACGALVAIQCSDPQYMTFTGLTPGQTYYLRVYTWSTSALTNSAFDICVGTLPPPPPNDDCINAIQVPVNPDLSCALVTSGSTASATPTTGETDPACGTGGLNDDVWYSFIATNNQHYVSLLNVTGIVTDMVLAVYSGSCGNLVSLECSDPNSTIVSGLTPGNTYYVRVWTWTSTVGSYANFQLCIGTPPPPYGNDEPCTAALLTIDYVCNYQQFHTFGATDSPYPDPGCSNYEGGDVWFKVVVPCEGALVIDTKQGMITDGGMAAYSGSCDGSLTLIDCDDDASPNGLMPQLNLANLTPGDTLYIRFFEYGNDNAGTFEICVSIPPPPTAGTACASAQPFCTSQTYNVPNTSGQPSLGGGGQYGCLGSTPNPAWYFMQVQTAGDIVIGISQTDANGVGLDVDYAVWGPFTSGAAACSGITAGNIISCSFSPAPTETATILNAQPGQFYMLLLTNYSDDPGTITFQQSGGTGQSSCAALCTIPATNSGPACPGRTVNLFTPGFSGATYLWTGPRCFTSTDQNPTNVVVPTIPGTYQYFVTATDAAGNSCSGFTEVVVLPRVSLGRDSVVNSCTGGTADLTTLYNTAGLTTAWTFNTTAVANPAAVTDAGIYQLIATNTDGCSDTALVTVSFAPQQFASDTTIAVCSGTDANLTTVFNTTGYSTVYEYGNTAVPDPTAVNVAGDYNLIVTSAGGCVDTVMITVNFNTVTATAVGANATCAEDGSITVTPGTGTAPFEYSISTNPGVFQSATVFTAPQGDYVITARDANGCTGTANVSVGFTDDLTLDPIDDEVICGENSVTLTAVSNATTLTWSPATGLSTNTGSTTVASPDETTTYTVTGVLGSCTKTEEVTVNLEAGITVNAGPDFTLSSGTTALMAATASGNIATYLWSPSTGLSATNVLNPVVTAGNNSGVQTYTLTVTSAEGCVASDQVDVTIIASCLRVRNAFTPNGDGNNDVWRVYDDNSCLKSATVQVFNRYGNKVFESKDYRNTWDGTFKGKPVPDATYYAVIEFFMADGTRRFVRTDLTILR